MSQTGAHSADSRVAGGLEADLVAVIVAVAVPDSADDGLSLHQQLQQFILLQRLSNAPNLLQTDSLLATLSRSTPSSASQGVLTTNNDMILNGASSSNYSLNAHSDQPPNMNTLQHFQQQSNPPSVGLLLSSLMSNSQHQPNNAGIISALQAARQLDQLQSSLVGHHSQQLPSAFPTASNQSSGQQQQSMLLDPLHQTRQTALLLQIQNSQDLPSIIAQSLANAASVSTRQEESGVDDGQSIPKEEQA